MASASPVVASLDVGAREWGMLIGGRVVGAVDGARYASVSPVSGEVLVEVPAAGAADVELAVGAAREAFAGWRDLAPRARAERVSRVIEVLAEHEEELATLDAMDGGNPVTAMRGDVRLAIALLQVAVDWVSGLRGQTMPGQPGHLHYTVLEPFGVVGKIIPYNHPLLFATRALVPLLVGNTVVLKTPDQTPLSPLRFGELVCDLFPAGVLNVISGHGPVAGDALVRHPDVRRIAFTGSPQTGRAIQLAAAQSAVKTVSLELGGKNPMIVMADADIEQAARGAVRGMNFHWSAGQSCGSTSRLLVHRSIADDLIPLVCQAMGEVRMGDPLDPATEMGTLVTRAHTTRVTGMISAAIEEGATLLAGGDQPALAGDEACFVSPTLLGDVTPDAMIAQEEVFGPVLSVLTWDTETQALQIANGTRYGLTASIFSTDIGKAQLLARHIDAGYVWINDASVHHPGMPFGGFKESGIGREEDPSELLAYTQAKSINVNLTHGALPT